MPPLLWHLDALLGSGRPFHYVSLRELREVPMEPLINILTNFLLYISIPVAIRYAILRRPIRSKWIAVIVLLPIFVVFATLIGNQREVAQKRIYEQAGMPYRSTPHMIGSTILYIAIALGFVVLRHGHTKKQPKSNEQVVSANENCQTACKTFQNRGGNSVQ